MTKRRATDLKKNDPKPVLNAVLGNSEEFILKLESESVDIICIDPPYLYLKKQKLEREFNEHTFFEECKRALKKGGFIILFGRGVSFYRWKAIEKVFDGSRKWDFEKYPDIEVHLIAIVKSLISSHFKSSVRSLVQAGGDTQELIEQSGNNDEVAYGTEPSPEEKWQAIKDAFADNGNDYVIYCEWLDGLPPREIAEALELPVRDVYNAIRKGTRIVKELFRKQL